MEAKQNSTIKNLIMLLVACIVTSLLIKLPSILPLQQTDSDFYLKNGFFICFFGLSLYVSLTKGFKKKIYWLWAALAFLIPTVYLNLLPGSLKNNTVILVYLHMALLMWCVYGIIFIGMTRKVKKRMDYIRYNGDLVVLSAIISMAGGLFSAITIGLFKLIGFNIDQLFGETIAVCGAVSIPIVATYVIKNNALVTNKIAPIIANIFSPMVLLMLTIFLISLPFSGKDPFNDRDFLLIFNILLLGVMAIIVFSVSETSKIQKQQFNKVILTLLAFVALIINTVALSAIIYRLGEYGFTPNRTAVLGSNLLLFVHLIWIAVSLFKSTFNKKGIELVEDTVSRYLPVYAVWTLIVVIGFPLIFGIN